MTQKILKADPVIIPSITETLLNKLELEAPATTKHQPSPQMALLASRLNNLPFELLKLTMYHLQPLHDLPLQCTAVLPPTSWLDGLLRGQFLPWLWDLEASVILDKEASKPVGREWNWEAFVRRLPQKALHEPRMIFDDVPFGLRNRRRIWRTVEEMYVNDAAPYRFFPCGYGGYLPPSNDVLERLCFLISLVTTLPSINLRIQIDRDE